MNPTYDLLTEPWIPVVQGGSTTEMNLKDVLLSAHDLDAMTDPMPIVEFGLYRLLVTLVMDIYKFQDTRHLNEVLESGRFDPAPIDDYFQQWGHCFDLFDPEHPFLQTADMDTFPDKPLAGLLPSVPSGTNSVHFHHADESDFAVSPAVAARLLCSVSPFMTAGGAGLAPSINGAPPWYVLIDGGKLFRTICLNCFVLPHEMNVNTPPAWRNQLPPKTDGRSTTAGLLEALTWRPRQIKLIPGGPGPCCSTGKHSPTLVSTMKFRAGASCDFSWRDPNVPYRITEKGPLAMRPQEDKELWRDTGPLMLLNDGRPRIIDQIERLYRNEDKALSVTVYGMRTDMKMKIFEWQKEKLEAPTPLVVDSKFAHFAQDCINEAGSVESALKRAIKHLARDDGKGNKAAFDTVIANATRRYWATLRPVYESLLHELAELPKDERAEAVFPLQDKWRAEEKEATLAVFGEACDNLDTYGDNIQRLIEAEANLRTALWRLSETPEQRNTRKKKSKALAASIEGGEE